MADVTTPDQNQQKTDNLWSKWFPKPSRSERIARIVAAWIAWAYIISELFFYDIDATIANALGSDWAWIIQFKFPVFLGVLTITFIVTRNRRIVAWLLYIATFPVRVIFWPTLYVGIAVAKTKSWTAIFTALNIILSTFQDIKFKFIVFSITLIAWLVIAKSQSKFLIGIAAFTLFIEGIVLLARLGWQTFRPARIFRIHKAIVSKLVTWRQKHFAPAPELRKLSRTSMDQKQLQDWSNSLQQAVFLYMFCLYLADRFQEYRRSSIQFVIYVFGVVTTIFIFVVLFTLCNYALWRLDSSAFSSNGIVSPFDFADYSFNLIFLNQIPQLVPASAIARALKDAEYLFEFLALTILFVALATVKKNVDDNEIDQTAHAFEAEAGLVETEIAADFSMSMGEALTELDQMQKSVNNLISIFKLGGRFQR